MSDAATISDVVLAAEAARQRGQAIDQTVPERAAIELPKARRVISMRPYYALLVAAIVAPAILFGVVAWQTRLYMLNAAMAGVQQTVASTASQAHDLLQIHRLLGERVDERVRGMSWDQIEHSQALNEYLKQLVAEYPQTTAIFLADASGALRASNFLFPQPPTSTADRDYFKALQSGNVDIALSEMQRGRTTGQLNFNLARRRTGPTDAFDGVVIVGVSQRSFVDFWGKLDPRPGAQFGLYRDDGRILARLPPADLAQRPLDPNGRLMRATREAQQGVFEAVSPVDGVDRFVAFQDLGDFNLFVIHGISRDSVIDAWRKQTFIIAVFFVVALVALTALALLTLRRARQEQYAFAEWEHTARSLHDEEVKTLLLNRDLRRRAAELEASNAELETFSYSVSHDLRTPLRAIDGYSAVLLQDYPDKLDAEGKRLLGVVRQATGKMGRLIDDILDFSRTGRLPMNMAEVDMESQVQGLIHEASTHLGDRKIRFEIAALPNVQADPSMIRRVWFNLIDNAIKFTAPKSNAVITIGGKRTEKEIVYSVVDNGVGFDRQFVGMLFGVGHRLVGVEYEGCGVGLAIVKRIVARHNGRVWADGIPNEGATFYFALPAERLDD